MTRSDWLWLLAYMGAGVPAAIFAWGAFYWDVRAFWATMAISIPISLVAYFLVLRPIRKERGRDDGNNR